MWTWKGIIFYGLLALLAVWLVEFIRRHFVIQELPLAERYGKGSWVLITGPNAGQGRRFAIEFAKRGFGIVLAGYDSCHEVAKDIELRYKIPTRVLVCDFGEAWRDGFFEPFEKVLEELDVSILVNNVGARMGWTAYEKMPLEKIRSCIAVGTIVQATLSRLALAAFRKRPKGHKSAIVNITTQALYPALWLQRSNVLSVPYTSVYEGANAFGLFQSISLEKELAVSCEKGDVDILTITPGAVITENTQFMKGTPFSVDCKVFVKNCLRMLGQVQGPTCAYWGHEIAGLLCNFVPANAGMFRGIGLRIAEATMETASEMPEGPVQKFIQSPESPSFGFSSPWSEKLKPVAAQTSSPFSTADQDVLVQRPETGSSDGATAEGELDVSEHE